MRPAPLSSHHLRQLLGEPKPDLCAALEDIHPEDVADVLRGQAEGETARMLEQLPAPYAAQVFERFEEPQQSALAELMGPETTARLTIEMAADDRADFFSVVPPEMSRQLLEELETARPDLVGEVQQLSRWEDTTAGGLMTTEYISVSETLTIAEAIRELRRRAKEAESVDALFVTASDGRLSGVLSLRRMLLAEAGDSLSSVMNRHVISVPPTLDQEAVAHKLAKYDLGVLPVVADDGRLLGVITADDVFDVLTEEQSEDVHKLGAVEPVAGYFSTTFGVFLHKRAPWLAVLFCGGLITTQTLQAYEGALSSMTQLSFYLPLLISAGGNSGAQSSTLVIRGLAVGDISLGDWLRVLRRETCQGLVLGGALSLLGMVRVILAGESLRFVALIATTVVGLVVLGCVTGAMAPLLLHRAGVDPATSSTPFIATVVDVLGIVLYLTLAQVLLGFSIA